MQRLQWRLMLSYILVTVAATFLIGAVVMVWLTDVLFFMHQKPAAWVDHARRTAAMMAPLVDRNSFPEGVMVSPLRSASRPDSVDAVAIRNLITDERDAVLHAGDEQDNMLHRGHLINFHMGVNPFPKNIAIVVIGRDGRIVAGSAIAGANEGLPLDPLLTANESRMLAGALAGERRPGRLGITDAVGIDSAAYPIFDAAGRLNGAVFERARTTICYSDWLIGSGSLVLFVTIFMAFVATVLGSVFSYMTSRGMTSRLEVMAEAAAAWSQGDFTAQALEKPGDELGELGRRLNGMAREVSDLLALRQRLATSEERNRLARDLHDTVKQQAFATAMQIGAARERYPDAATTVHIDEAAKLVAAMQQELKSILRELSDEGTVDVGIVLKERVIDWSRRSEIAVEMEIATGTLLPTPTAAAVLAIVEEGLSNVARHSEASLAKVEFGETATGQVELTISDDGQGIDYDIMPGMGLGNMRKRAESLPGGKFTLDSHPGKGVHVWVNFVTTEVVNGRQL